jgi:hypothetical protein
MAGVGVFLGLSMTTVSLLRGEGVTIPWLQQGRAAMLLGALLWSVVLAWRIGGRWTQGGRRVGVAGCVALAGVAATSAWGVLFWVW